MAAKGTSDITVIATEPGTQLQQESSVEKNEGEEGQEREDESSAVVTDPREYACHGLGKGIDATAVHPWESRSPYQARAVTASDTVMLYEGMRVHQYSEQIDSYYDIQGSIETSLKIPNKPIEMGVAADASRSSWFSKLVRGKKVLKCTIAFDRRTRLHSSAKHKKKSTFELDLETWIIDQYPEVVQDHSKDHEERVQQCILAIRDKVEKKISRASVKQRYEKKNPLPSGSDSAAKKAHEDKIDARLQEEVKAMQEEELAGLCKQFLLSLGGITHYISSITLGAMEYTQSKSSSEKTSYSQTTSVGVERLTKSQVKVSGSKSLSKVLRDTEKLGRFKYDGDSATDYIGDQEEAVVHYAFTPLSSLMKRQDLSKAVQQAIREYTNEQLSTLSGPYLISCTEPMDGHTLYWKIDREDRDDSDQERPDGYQELPDPERPDHRQFVIKPTTNYREASNFYIELDRHRAGGFFFITTTDDPTEPQSGEVEKNRPDIKRYVHIKMHKWIDNLRFGSKKITLAAYATVVKDSMSITARFQAVDHQSHQKRTLEQSDWLPDKGRLDQSQPCFLTPHLHSYCLAVVRKSERLLDHLRHQPHPIAYEFCIDSIKHHQEGKCHMLFTLTRPPSDYNTGSTDTHACT